LTDQLRRLVAAAHAGDAAALARLAEALFHSPLLPTEHPTAAAVRLAIAESVLQGVPDPATEDLGRAEAGREERMRWCRNVVALTYCEPPEDATSEHDYLRDLFWRRA
jgi:hypothetical protein